MLDNTRSLWLLSEKWMVVFRLAIIQGIGMAIVFGSNLLLTNILTNTHYGEYVSILQGVMLISVLIIGGLDELITIEMPRFLQMGDLSAAKNLYKWANQYILKRFITIITIAFILYVGYKLLFNRWLVSITVFIMAAIVAYLTTLFTKQSSEFRSGGHYQLIHLLESIAKAISFPIILLIAIYLLKLPPTTKTTIGSLLLSLILIVFVTQIYLSSKQPYLKHFSAQLNGTKELSQRTRLPIFNRSALLHYLLLRIDILILIAMASSSAVGQYNVLNRLAEWCMIPAILINTVHIKEVAEIQNDYQRVGFPSLVNQLIRKSALTTLLIAGILLATGTWILKGFGTSYAEGYFMLFPMTGSFLCMAIAAPMNHWLKVIGREAKSLQITWITVTTQLTLCAVLIYFWGPMGAALGTLISNALYLLLQIQASKYP